jgi:hypothetical protein
MKNADSMLSAQQQAANELGRRLGCRVRELCCRICWRGSCAQEGPTRTSPILE